MSDLDQRVRAARNFIQQAIPIFKNHFGNVKSLWKEDGTRVTEADIAISKKIKANVLTNFPNDIFCSEEDLPKGEDEVLFSSKYAWVLDPIDGTNNYAKGIPLCAISLAILENGLPIFGIIYDFAQNKILEGGQGYPLKKGDFFVEINEEIFDSNGIISVHFPMPQRELFEFTPLLSSNVIRCQGSAALNLAYNAFGAIDGSIDYNTKIWDIAAACALLIPAKRKIIYLGKPAFPIKKMTAKMPVIRWIAGSNSFIDRARDLGLF